MTNNEAAVSTIDRVPGHSGSSRARPQLVIETSQAAERALVTLVEATQPLATPPPAASTRTVDK
jgi:hypothetical protein